MLAPEFIIAQERRHGIPDGGTGGCLFTEEEIVNKENKTSCYDDMRDQNAWMTVCVVASKSRKRFVNSVTRV